MDGTSYLYDESGNLLDDGTHTYQYNYRNLLTRVVAKSDGSEVASYGYDPLGRRIFKTVNGEMTRFIYEGVHIIAEVAPDDSISKEFIYGSSVDDPIAMLNGGEIYYYHTDGLGSTTALTNRTGEVVETYQYGAYGEPEIHDGVNGALLEQSAVGNSHLYTGQIYDAETGFYYYKARYYSPHLGRFLQRDPLGYVDGYNLYAYTNNNPLNWIDPLGTDPKQASHNTSAGNPQQSWLSRLVGVVVDYWKQNNKEANLRFEREGKLMDKWLQGNMTQAERTELDQIQFDRAYEMATGMMGEIKLVGNVAENTVRVAENAFTYYMRKVETLDVSTPKNGAVFWSGQGNRTLAEEFAEANGKFTLEKTPGGKWLEQQQLLGPNSSLTQEQALEVWSRLSQRYAEGASGTAVGFVNGVKSTSIFSTVEYRSLLNNQNVVNIVTGGH